MIKYEHLLGKQFQLGKNDCYSIIRDFYNDNFGIVLPNFARPTQFWDHGMNLYMDRFPKLGFKVLHVNPHEYQIGDLFIMSIQSNVANHAAILIEKGMILHHLMNQISTVTPYRGIWRNNTVAVIRHKDVVIQDSYTNSNILEHVPDHIRRKVNDYFEQQQTLASQ